MFFQTKLLFVCLLEKSYEVSVIYYWWVLVIISETARGKTLDEAGFGFIAGDFLGFTIPLWSLWKSQGNFCHHLCIIWGDEDIWLQIMLDDLSNIFKNGLQIRLNGWSNIFNYVIWSRPNRLKCSSLT